MGAAQRARTTAHRGREAARHALGLEDKATLSHAYVQSLALVLALQREFGERFVFELVSACGRGEDAELVVERMTGRRLDEFEF